jgi:hypothetical protein
VISTKDEDKNPHVAHPYHVILQGAKVTLWVVGAATMLNEFPIKLTTGMHRIHTVTLLNKRK